MHQYDYEYDVPDSRVFIYTQMYKDTITIPKIWKLSNDKDV